MATVKRVTVDCSQADCQVCHGSDPKHKHIRYEFVVS